MKKHMIKIKNISNNQKMGFTIIEVVLVLAIAGLIFLMVFIALPALQRSQRDSVRRQHASSIISAFNNRYINGRRRIRVGDNYALIENMIAGGYLKDEEVRDPSTGQVYVLNMENVNWRNMYDENVNFEGLNVGEYTYDLGGYCEGNTPRDDASNYGSAIILIKLESGGVVCASNDIR